MCKGNRIYMQSSNLSVSVRVVLILITTTSLQLLAKEGNHSPSLPQYGEILQLLQSHLKDVSEKDLEHAALQGILTEFQGRIELFSPLQINSSPEPTGPSIAKREIFSENIAYIRLRDINEQTSNELVETIESFKTDGKLKGLTLDLRYLESEDYKSAARVAELFIRAPMDFMDLGEGVERLSPSTQSVDFPLAILINEATEGAAEVLAAGLKHSGRGALVGRFTQGTALLRERITLSSGHLLSIALGPVRLGDGKVLDGKGVEPDILVDVTPTEQAALFDDPFAKLEGTSKEEPLRLNEAELMRRMEQLKDTGIEDSLPSPEGNSQTNFELLDGKTAAQEMAIVDPILARGIDLLKGWSIFSKLKP